MKPAVYIQSLFLLGLVVWVPYLYTVTQQLSFASREISKEKNIQTALLEMEQVPNSNCLRFDSGLKDLISKSKQIFIIMAAKSAGTSLKEFTYGCTKQKKRDNLINYQDKLEELFQDTVDLPKVITSHVYNDVALKRLLQNTPRDTLLIYIHREETSRLKSSIKQVLQTYLCPSNSELHPTILALKASMNMSRNGTHCEVQENELIEKVIIKRVFEIGIGAPDILSCSVYEKLEETGTKIVFLNYKQANRLQTLIAAKFCPYQENRHENVGTEKEAEVSVKLDKDGQVVKLETWVDAKGDMLEYTYRLKKSQTCQYKTRKMEDKMLACYDEMIIM